MEELTLQDKVEQALIEQLEASAWDINVQVRNNSIFLSGVVDVLGDKLTAEDIVREVSGIQAVENGLTVAMEHGATDSEIKRAVEESFQVHGDSEVEEVGVGVYGGNVYLVGTVRNLEVVERAKLIASQVIGVKDIISQLKIAQEVRMDDAALTNNVARALANSNINVNEVDINVGNGKVLLQGWARELGDREKLEQVVKTIPGVRRVDNHLHTRDLESEEDASRLT